ncbi:MAG: hypothetical protein DI536_29475 [Archangium gephyra]|uniref:Type I restriction modification DNA specificity domain-containing protein n=1 Tax=Archangium gephyra TaxID=48 RepID=A0A2W5SUS1_9BACT|nr:MAG: hypothetical protein DI536_29475 [Archangium gephyra]
MPGKRALLRGGSVSDRRVAQFQSGGIMKSPAFRRFVDGLNTGTLIQHMFTSQLDEWVFALPPLAEQNVIVREVESAFAKWTSSAELANSAQSAMPTLERTLLAKAFRGELVT